MTKLFFPVVGAWWLVGSFVVIAFVHEPFADKVLREWTYIFAKPYEHGAYGHVFVLWAGVINACFGWCLMRAPRWDPAARNAVLMSANACYLMVFGLAIAGLGSPNYGPGIYIAIPLWGGLLGWGLAVKRAGV